MEVEFREGWREEVRKLTYCRFHFRQLNVCVLSLGGIQIVIPSYRPCAIPGYSVLPALNTRGAMFKQHLASVIRRLAMLISTCKIT